MVPTLAADSTYMECLQSLKAQTMQDFETVVVDNSGAGLVPLDAADRVIRNQRNVGFGAAVNQAYRASQAPFLATLNDDAVAHPQWLASLLAAMETRPRIGMCASQVRLSGSGADRLDSAGMLLCRDGSSRQRGHGQPPSQFPRLEAVLLPSASAALYRGEMLKEIGLFDESFFLYCEDTDLGLRARWAAWECLYVPEAVVEHRYSHSAGRASALKAYYAERNRLFLVLKNFPMELLVRAPFHAVARYFWHVAWAAQGQGAAAEFGRQGNGMLQLPVLVLRAHWEMLRNLRALWRQRRAVKRRITGRQFQDLLAKYAISARQVAAL